MSWEKQRDEAADKSADAHYGVKRKPRAGLGGQDSFESNSAYCLERNFNHRKDYLCGYESGYDQGRADERERSEKLVEALEKIVKKVPEKVSREEAADMAIEFKQLALKVLAAHAEREEQK